MEHTYTKFHFLWRNQFNKNFKYHVRVWSFLLFHQVWNTKRVFLGRPWLWMKHYASSHIDVTIVPNAYYCNIGIIFFLFIENHCAITKIGALFDLWCLCHGLEWIQSAQNSLLWGLFGSAKLINCRQRFLFRDIFCHGSWIGFLSTMILNLGCPSHILFTR